MFGSPKNLISKGNQTYCWADERVRNCCVWKNCCSKWNCEKLLKENLFMIFFFFFHFFLSHGRARHVFTVYNFSDCFKWKRRVVNIGAAFGWREKVSFSNMSYMILNLLTKANIKHKTANELRGSKCDDGKIYHRTFSWKCKVSDHPCWKSGNFLFKVVVL